MRILKLDIMTTTTSTNNSVINFNLENLAGSTMLRKSLLDYIIYGNTSTFNVYYNFNNIELPFLIKIGEDYISVTEMLYYENILRINIINREKINCEEEEQKMIDFRNMIGISIERYLTRLIDSISDGSILDD